MHLCRFLSLFRSHEAHGGVQCTDCGSEGSWCGNWCVSKLLRVLLSNSLANTLYVAAKNVILAGVKSVTIYDPEPVQLSDLSSQVTPTLESLIVLLMLKPF